MATTPEPVGAPRAAAPRTVPPELLASIKDDLGIAADDSTSDAWLSRRIDGIWARFQVYTGRPLQLSSGWADDWGRLVQNAPALTQPPLIRAWPSGSVFLRVFPVQQITKLTLDGIDWDVSRIDFDGEEGKLVGIDGRAIDLRHWLVHARARVEYMAGFDTLPADLYEALLGAVQQQWASRQSQQAGLGTGGVVRISAIDVGDIEIASVAPFTEAAMKGVGAGGDPLLGPFASYLDPYIDWRSMIGGPYPVTEPLPATAQDAA